MTETITLGGIKIAVTRKNVRNVHLSVHPPDGRVTLTAPRGTRLDVAHAYAASRIGWIRRQQAQLRGQARETPRQYITRESHYLWGRRYLLAVAEADAKPSVKLSHRTITLTVRPGSDTDRRREVMQEWHRSVLHSVVPALIRKWETKLGVASAGYFVQRMKTRWGSCNHTSRTIRLNTELVRKPKDLLEYVIAHELAHLRAPNHREEFQSILDASFPGWRNARAELNELPLAAETWGR